jgi:hypothetical protein
MSLCAALLAASMLAPVPGSAATDAARREVVAVEHRWLEHQSDPQALADILADDFVHPVSGGVFISKTDQIAWAGAHPARPGRAARFEKLDVRIYGEVAIATGVVEARDPGAAAARRTLFTDVFVRRQGRWRAVNAQETPAS